MEALRLPTPETDLDAVNAALSGATAEEIVAWAAESFGEGLVVSSSFGVHSAVMLHLVQRIAPATPVIFIDTGYLFPETYRFAESLVARLGLRLEVFSPRMTAARMEALHGRLWEQGPEGVEAYLRIAKVEPMQHALQALGATAWLAGLRHEQTTHRASLRVVERQNGRLKVHPILRWDGEAVAEYLSEHDLPRHPLYDEGYRSIGDWHSTLPTTPGQDPREGRILGRKRECGLHLPLSPDEDASLKSSGL